MALTVKKGERRWRGRRYDGNDPKPQAPVVTAPRESESVM